MYDRSTLANARVAEGFGIGVVSKKSSKMQLITLGNKQ